MPVALNGVLRLSIEWLLRSLRTGSPVPYTDVAATQSSAFTAWSECASAELGCQDGEGI